MMEYSQDADPLDDGLSRRVNFLAFSLCQLFPAQACAWSLQSWASRCIAKSVRIGSLSLLVIFRFSGVFVCLIQIAGIVL